MMERRTFLATLAGSLLATPLAAEAQQAKRAYRIGWITPAVIEGGWRAFREAMRALGYVEGQTVAFESRSAEDHLDRLPRLAGELVHSKVDVIVAVSPPAILAARQATNTIPIVMAFWGTSGLIESGIVATLSRPGGNVSGVYMLAAELDAKRLELLVQAVPKARKVGVLDPGPGFTLTEVQKVAKALGVQLHVTAAGGGREGYRSCCQSASQAAWRRTIRPPVKKSATCVRGSPQMAHGSRAGSCKAKRALSSVPRRSIDGASLGKSPEAISARILARSSPRVMAGRS